MIDVNSHSAPWHIYTHPTYMHYCTHTYIYANAHTHRCKHMHTHAYVYMGGCVNVCEQMRKSICKWPLNLFSCLWFLFLPLTHTQYCGRWWIFFLYLPVVKALISNAQLLTTQQVAVKGSICRMVATHWWYVLAHLSFRLSFSIITLHPICHCCVPVYTLRKLKSLMAELLSSKVQKLQNVWMGMNQ